MFGSGIENITLIWRYFSLKRSGPLKQEGILAYYGENWGHAVA
jgi:hypothetical protein